MSEDLTGINAITATVVEHQGELSRAEQVKQRLLEVQNNIEGSFFDLCDLLLEAQENNYHQDWGYVRFSDWIDEASGLNIGSRQAYYYINIAKKSRELGLGRDEVVKVGISKLKEIFMLEPQEHGKQMQDLLEAAPEATLEDIKDAVRQVTGKQPAQYMTLKLEPDIKETVKRAFELARRNHGDTVVNGEVQDISDSRCLELICVEYLNDPNNFPEGESPASFVTEAVL